LEVKEMSFNYGREEKKWRLWKEAEEKKREIHKLLRNAFNQGIKWALMSRNPVQNATLPKEERKKRDIWTVETLSKALEVCDDDNLSLALNLAFSCSLRMGEMLGLTWDCIDISERSIKNDCAYIFVNKELQRVNLNALEQLGEKGVMFKFPPAVASTISTNFCKFINFMLY